MTFVNLTKVQAGEKVDLTKAVPGMTSVFVGVRWDAQQFDGREKVDVDLVCFPYNLQNGIKVTRPSDFVFYNQPTDPSGAVVYSGDNPDGVDRAFVDPRFAPFNGKYDEMMFIDFSKAPAHWTHVAFAVNIDEAVRRGQTFGRIHNARFDIINPATMQPIKEFDLGENWSTQTAVVGIELYRHQADWKLQGVGDGFNQGLDALCAYYGFQAAYQPTTPQVYVAPPQQQQAPQVQGYNAAQGNSAFPGFNQR